jgi:2-hydroxychromene-2-carboxylate isomerase
MNKYIDFYFDIISPYAFIAHKKIEKIQKKKKIFFNYMPILLGGLHNLAGITAPAFNKFKMINMRNDCDLVSKKMILNLNGMIIFLLILFLL